MSNKATLTEHNTRLSAIKAKVEELLKGYTVTVSFNEGDTVSGSYTIDGGGTSYFEGDSFTISGVKADSTVVLTIPNQNHFYEIYGSEAGDGVTGLDCMCCSGSYTYDSEAETYYITLSEFTSDADVFIDNYYV